MIGDARGGQSTPAVRRVRLLLRDGTSFDGGIHLGAGQALAPYLTSRKSGWLNLINVRWPGTSDELPHLVLQGAHLLAVLPQDPDVPVFTTTLTQDVRVVEMRLEDGRRLRGKLHLSDRQRLADYLHTTGTFIPCSDCAWVDGERLGNVVLNTAALRELHDIGSPGSA